MKILFLTQFEEVDDFLLDFIHKINSQLPTDVELLHVINSYPEVPLQQDGTIIDFCSDFDLSALESSKKEKESKAAQLMEASPAINSASISIGNLELVLKHKLSKNNYDFIVVGAHRTTVFEYFTHESVINRIMEVSTLPVLSLKCDQSHNQGIENIGLFDEFKNDTTMPKLSALAKAMEATVHLYFLTEKELNAADSEERLKKMSAIAEANHFEKYSTKIINLDGRNEEEAIMEALRKDQLHLVAINQLHSHKFHWLVNDSLKDNIANHVFAPLLIY